MIRADLHCHSTDSLDGVSSPSEMLAGAEERGLSVLCLTEHCECPGFMAADGSHGVVYMKERIIRSRELLLSSSSGIDLPFGIELGQASQERGIADEIIGSADYDFVIGSLHNIKNELDFSLIKYDSADMCRSLLDRYFYELLETAETTEYDSLGHIGYPLRYMPSFDSGNTDYSGYTDKLREVFSVLISKGKALELNTAPVRRKLPGLCAAEISLFRSMGGQYITVGSDAHKTGDIASDFDLAENILRTAGFNYYTIYKNRNPVNIEF